MAEASDTALAALRQVIDPELGVNIVDLGLVYGVDCAEEVVRVRLTMTSPSCPLGEYVVEQAEDALRTALPAARSIAVDLVWEPAWSPERMSAEGRRQLGYADG